MKKLLLFFLFISSVIYAQPPIAQPDALVVYENPFDGFATFDLWTTESQILNGLISSDFTISFHESQNDADLFLNPIANPDSYLNFIINLQTIYVRVEEVTVPSNFATTSFEIKVNSDFITFEDANFKTKLIALGIDTNNDNEIQYTEAANTAPILDVSFSNISSLQGISYFTNITNLICASNQITTLDVSALTNLTYLSCGSNDISMLNVASNVNLVHLLANNNDLTNLSLTNHPNLESVWVNNNALTTLDVSGCAALEELSVGNNDLTILDVSNNILLIDLQGAYNQFMSVDYTANTNLQLLDVSYNLIMNINVAGLTQLESLSVQGNQLNAIDVSTLSNLESLSLVYNALTTLDCSLNTNLKSLYIYGNELVTLFLKNGSNESSEMDAGSWWESLNGNPTLQYICADDNEIQGIQNIVSTGVNVNSYCSFTPGGDYSTISGITHFDADDNGCDVSDTTIPFVSYGVSLDGVATNGQIYATALGSYNFYTSLIGTYGITPNLENPTYFNVSPNPANINLPAIDNSTITQNFCITANGIHNDLEVVIVPVIPARPGFDAVYKIVYKNKGNQTVDGYVNFAFNGAVLDYVSASVVPTDVLATTMNWSVPNLAPFQVGTILVTFNVNSPQETPAVNIGDILVFNAFIDVNTDETWVDNNFDFNQTVVGSYDPNDITCLEGNTLPTAEMGKYLHYNIRFENTGTALAENIVVKSEIDLTQYNIQSLQIMESSHLMTVKVTGNIAEFIFESINLDTGGHGNILLKLKSKAILSDDLVVNSADIFFDYNFPIITNDEQTVFADLSKSDFNKDVSILVYPNPAENVIYIKSESTIHSIQMYDAQGRMIQAKLSSNVSEVVNLTNYSSGLYFITVKTDKGIKTQKIIKK